MLLVWLLWLLLPGYLGTALGLPRVLARLGLDGWTGAGETWTYASASTFTVPGDQTAKYTAGTFLKFTNTTVKYAVVASSSFGAGTTTVTIFVNTDYTLANAAISANYYAYGGNPQGFPGRFAYDCTPSGWAATPTQTVSEYTVVGREVTVYIDVSGTSNATTVAIHAPVASQNVGNQSFQVALGHTLDNGVAPAAGGYTNQTANTVNINCFLTNATGAWTGSGTKQVIFQHKYPF